MTDLDSWVEALETELGLPPGTVDVGAVLDLARDAAHAVARPAAPVTTYAVGYAAGLAAAARSTAGEAAYGRANPADAQDVAAEIADRAAALAARWSTD
jgi:hypothetical protein